MILVNPKPMLMLGMILYHDLEMVIHPLILSFFKDVFLLIDDLAPSVRAESAVD